MGGKLGGVKRGDFERRMRKLAKKYGYTAEFTDRTNHAMIQIGAWRSVYPRHSEINEITALAILRNAEDELKGMED